MAARAATVRCPRCGQFIGAVGWSAGPAAWYACPHCGAPVPVVGVRDPPPLFSWEVYPHLYPALPPPRASGPSPGVAVAWALFASTLLLAGFAGYLGVQGGDALTSGPYTLHGTVVGVPAGGRSPVPLDGAAVYVVGENGFVARGATDAAGNFALGDVPAGAVNLTVSYPGYSAVTEQLFLTRPLDTAAGGVTVTLLAGGPAAGTTIVTSSFNSLESLVATLWSGASLFAVAAFVAAYGAQAAFQRRRPPLVIASGAGAALSPAAAYLLGLPAVYPDLTYLSAGLVTLGLLAATFTAIPMARTGPAPDP